MTGVSAGWTDALGPSVVAVFLMTLAVNCATALDWRQPWTEPQDSAAAASHSDEYAWRLFVALNWPADTVGRAADAAARFGAERAAVWETWQSAGDVYLAHGADPGAWAPHDPGRTPEPARRFETLSLRDLRNTRHIVGGVMVPLLDPLEMAKRLTEIRMNRTTFDFIRARELYNVEGQMRAYAAGAVSLPYGAKEVKAKWRPVSQRESSRYHTTWVTLADGTRRLYGLTALHIASKDLPHWFWATFEHVDNPTLADNEGWQLPSRDLFACRTEPGECNRAPVGIGLEGTVWQYYRLRGTLTRYTDATGTPQLLANSELEAGMQRTASCITCHSRAALRVVDGAPERPAVFAGGDEGSAPDVLRRRGFVGEPRAEWFGHGTGSEPHFRQLDFVWSMANAQRKTQ